VGSYKAWLDRLMDVFGEERVIFGSDWPNSVAAYKWIRRAPSQPAL
jgi:predicted TIM-barrel fold metal-dependent hydrolase